jgi:transcriptional regulator with XRE-family HTH domain
MELYDKVRAIRRMIGVSQKPVADAIKVSVQAYSKKESGNTSITTDELQKIAHCLNVPVTIFFEEELNIKFNDISKREVS